MLPIGDYPNPPKPQWATRILIGINVAIHLFFTMPMEQQQLTDEEFVAELPFLEKLAESRGDDVAAWRGITKYDLFLFKTGGYIPGRPTLLALLLCMFLHSGFGHLFGNMLFLWIYGDNVEYRLGKFFYLVWYLATGAVATLSFAFMAGDSLIPLVGASGAISGILGFYLVWFPHNYVKIFLLFPFFGIFPIRAYWVLGIYLVLENLLPMLAAAGGNVAYGAHLGGFVAGAVLALIYNSVKGAQPAPKPERFAGYQPGRGPAEPQWREVASEPIDHGGDFEQAVREGRMEAAAHAFSRLQREGGKRPEPHAVFRLGRWLYDEGFSPDAAAVFRYFIKNYPTDEDVDRAHLGLGILFARRLGRPAAAKEHLHQAIELADTPGIAETARAELERLG
ncbi:MAG: rhomboid family intramembrane serine protease [Planctomycetota bacterium]|jgi:membrane associated rhomboid family serine protease